MTSSGSGGNCETGSGTSGGPRVAFGTGTAGGLGLPTTPQVGDTHTATDAPPAISGGTLRIMADGNTASAADPDRDQVYVVDLGMRTVSFTVALQPGDEPGRVAIDAAGRAHVALRRGGALVTIAPSSGTILERRDVCAAPRGVAYDAANDLVHVACADGQLVSLPAAGGPATRTLQLDADLRDVVVDGSQLHVTRFRSAELLTLDATGTVMNRVTPPPFRSTSTRQGELYTASVAWRALEMPTGGVVMVHQRGLTTSVDPVAGGYGSAFGNGQCDSIVQTAVTVVAPGQASRYSGHGGDGHPRGHGDLGGRQPRRHHRRGQRHQQRVAGRSAAHAAGLRHQHGRRHRPGHWLHERWSARPLPPGGWSRLLAGAAAVRRHGFGWRHGLGWRDGPNGADQRHPELLRHVDRFGRVA